jgi:hypothetical protein
MPFNISAGVLLHSVNIDSVIVFKAVVLCLRPEVVDGLVSGVLCHCWGGWLELGALEKGGADVRDLPASESCVVVSDQVGGCVGPDIVGTS